MLATYASAAFICAGALLIGQAVLRLCGASRWSWLSAPVGLASMVLIAVPSLHAPGRSTAVAVLLFVLVAAAAVWLLRDAAYRPPVGGLLAGAPVALLTTLPFLTAGTAGTLGWSFNNDMASHLLLADAYRSDAVERLHALLPDYPLGPHALVAVVAQGLGVDVAAAFAGLTIAGTVLLGWTALAALREPRRWAPMATALLVGMPFLVAAYYGQGAFKEVLQALLVLGTAVFLACSPALGSRRRWIPAALLLAGSLSVYSFPGLAWPVAFLGLWLAGTGLRQLTTTGSVGAVVREARAGLPGVLAGLVILVLAITPQIPRLHAFITNNTADINKADIGNLVGRLPIWESFGIWDNPDFRLPAADPFTNGLWAALGVGLVVFGACWALRRREWMLVAAAAMSTLIWAVADRSQSPYVAAKALVILSPLLMLVAARALGERDAPGRRMPSWWWLAAPALAVVLVVRVGGSSWDALRQSKVGPTDHTRELRSLQPTLAGRPTLYLGNDDFIRWELDQTPVQAPVVGFADLPFRPEKPWTYGMNYDVDSLSSTTLNQFDWVIAPRDAASSTPPSELRPVRRTRNFVLYRRTATIPARSVLAEGESAVARLNCRTVNGRRIVRAGGVAAIRDAPVAVAAPPLAPGQSATVSLPLTPGTWDLVSPYTGPRPLVVTAPGLRTTLVAHFDRPGPRWPIGRVTVTAKGAFPVTLRPKHDSWTPPTAVDIPGSIVAVRVGTERTVPIARACGRFVDWYHSP